MKNNLFFVLSFCFCLISQAQNSMNYKAIINDDQGMPLSNQLIVIQFGILQGDSQTLVYSENHTPTTDSNGLVILNIGEGTILSGDYTTINWASDTHFLNVQVNSGGGFVDLGTTQFLTVPYAISAETAANVNGLEAIDEGNGIGWRLVGSNPNFYGNIGLGAIDLSQSSSDVIDFGATGENATAFGFQTQANSFSIAGGFQSIASGVVSIALGGESLASGLGSTAIGSNATAQGDGTTALGSQTFAEGDQSTALGFVASATGNQAVAIGSNVDARSFAETVLGRYNTSYTPASTTFMNPNDRLLVVGNGTAANNASDALILYKNGALQVGEESEALGEQSFASGRFTQASGITSTAMGNFSQALGDRSTALGFETQASGEQSIAIGTSSVASGERAITLANASNASGDYAMAFGSGTIAPSYRETVVGSYNTEYTPLSTASYVSLDRLFVIGNGAGSLSRSNAMTVLKNGNVGIGTSNPQERFHIANGRLRIGTETVEDTGSNRLEWNSSLFPDTDDTFQLGGSSLRWEAVWATDGTINTSDRREKRDIQDVQYGLREILNLSPVRFRWKAKPEQGEKLGLIAQDVLEVIPEVVKTHEFIRSDDSEHATLEKKELERLGVYYTDLIPVLIKAIQEQQEIIDTQNKKISQLSEQTKSFSDLEKRITILETANQ